MNIKPHKNKMVAPCWRSIEPMGALGDHSISNIWTGEKAQDLREQFLSGEKPEGCGRCWSVEESESSQSISLRNRYNKIHSQYLPEIEAAIDANTPLPLKSVEFRFSSLCNFRCLHCHPANSTKWQKLWLENSEIQEIVLANKKNLPLKIFEKDQIDEFISHFSSTVEEVWICGGEPLIEPLHYYFLEQYPDELAQKVRLVVCTNFSKLEIPNFNIKPLWKKFKHVDVRIGIDGDKQSYEYFRYGGKYHELSENIKRSREWGHVNLELSGVCTVNNLNISKLNGIYELSRELKLPFRYMFLNGHPDFLDIRNLPKEFKEKFSLEIGKILKYSDLRSQESETLNNVLTFMNSKTGNVKLMSTLKRYCQIMDQESGMSWQDYFPELEAILG